MQPAKLWGYTSKEAWEQLRIIDETITHPLFDPHQMDLGKTKLIQDWLLKLNEIIQDPQLQHSMPVKKAYEIQNELLTQIHKLTIKFLNDSHVQLRYDAASKHDVKQETILLFHFLDLIHRASAINASQRGTLKYLKLKIYRFAQKRLEMENSDLHHQAKVYGAENMQHSATAPSEWNPVFDLLAGMGPYPAPQTSQVFFEDEMIWITIQADLEAKKYIGQMFKKSEKIPASLWRQNIYILPIVGKLARQSILAILPVDNREQFEGKTFAEAIALFQEREKKIRNGEVEGSNAEGVWIRLPNETELRFYAWDSGLRDLDKIAVKDVDAEVEIFRKKEKNMQTDASSLSHFEIVARIPLQEFQNQSFSEKNWTPVELLKFRSPANPKKSFSWNGRCESILLKIKTE